MNFNAILWNYKPRKDGSCNIKLYASVDGKKTYFKTKLAGLPKDFDEVKGVRVRKSHPSSKLYNATLRSKIRALEDFILEGGNFQNLGKDKATAIIPFLQKFIVDTAVGSYFVQ